MVTPMKSDGAKMPPEPPMPIDTLVARIFPKASTMRNQTA
jgi:hypothetical protein